MWQASAVLPCQARLCLHRKCNHLLAPPIAVDRLEKSEFLSTETFMPLSQMTGGDVTPVQVCTRKV